MKIFKSIKKNSLLLYGTKINLMLIQNQTHTFNVLNTLTNIISFSPHQILTKYNSFIKTSSKNFIYSENHEMFNKVRTRNFNSFDTYYQRINKSYLSLSDLNNMKNIIDNDKTRKEKSYCPMLISLTSVIDEFDWTEGRIKIYSDQNDELRLEKVYTSEERNKIAIDLDNLLKNKTNLIQIGGLAGIGKSYSLINYTLKKRLENYLQFQLHKEQQKTNPFKGNVITYLYCDEKSNSDFCRNLFQELLFGCFNLIQEEMKSVQKEDEYCFIEKDTLLNSFFTIFDKFLNYPDDKSMIKDILNLLENIERKNQNVILIFDQINELFKSDRSAEISFKTLIKSLNINKYQIICCGSNNNEFSRQNIKKDSLNAVYKIYNLPNKLIDNFTAIELIKSKGFINESIIDRIREATNDVPLFLSWLQKVVKQSNEHDQFIEEENTLSELIEKIKKYIDQRIDSFINSYYKEFSKNDKIEFQKIIMNLNANVEMDYKEIKKINDNQLIDFQKNEKKPYMFFLVTKYPLVKESYLRRLNIPFSTTSIFLEDVISSWKEKKYGIAGNKFESAFKSFMENESLGNLPSINPFFNYPNGKCSYEVDLFDNKIKNKSKSQIQVDHNPKITPINIAQPAVDKKALLCDIISDKKLVHLYNRTYNLKFIDGAFLKDDDEHISLYTYDLAQGLHKSKFENHKKYLDFIKHISGIDSIMNEFLHKDILNIKKLNKVKYVKHLIIHGSLSNELVTSLLGSDPEKYSKDIDSFINSTKNNLLENHEKLRKNKEEILTTLEKNKITLNDIQIYKHELLKNNIENLIGNSPDYIEIIKAVVERSDDQTSYKLTFDKF